MPTTEELLAEALARIDVLENAVTDLTEHIERHFSYLHILNAKVDDHHQMHVEFIEHHVDTGDIATTALAIAIEPDEVEANTLAEKLQARIGEKVGGAMKRDEINDTFEADPLKARAYCARRACQQHEQQAASIAAKIAQNGNGRADAARRDDIVARRDQLKAMREAAIAAKAEREKTKAKGKPA